MIEIFDCEQNSPEWLAVRLGIPTASNFAAILAKGEGKTRRSYMFKLAYELITGVPAEQFTTPDMERGHALEAEARELYAFVSETEPQLAGFVRNGGVGASPDALIGANGLLEIKTKRGDLFLEGLIKDEFPPEHKAQVQGQLWVTEREWCDLCCYSPGLPAVIKRAYRDATYIRLLESAMDKFIDDLAGLIDLIRTRGGY